MVEMLTGTAMEMVMRTAEPAIPNRPIRCSDLRPARSTTNSYRERGTVRYTHTHSTTNSYRERLSDTHTKHTVQCPLKQLQRETETVRDTHTVHTHTLPDLPTPR